MKILMISHEYPPIGGGGANACLNLGKGFSEKGHEVTLVTANYQNMPLEEKSNGITIYRVNSKRKYKDHCSFSEMMSFIFKACPVADKLEKREKYDICLIFFGIPSGVLGYYLKRKYKLPYVIRFGGGDIPGAQERFKYVYKVISPAIKIIWKNAKARIANSTDLRNRAYLFCEKYRFDVIQNGVDANIFKTNEGHDNNIINILFVSRIIEGKGLQFFIPKLRYIINSTQKKVGLTIVGDGPYRAEIETIITQQGVKQFVNMVGHKDKEQIVDYYRQGDIFILPSMKEGMPNVVLEAMACGLPIVMTPCGGSDALIKDNGFIADIATFADRVIELINDDDLRGIMANNSRKRAIEQFSWANTVKEYEKVMSR